MLIALNGISKSYQASHGAPPYQVLKDANLSIDKGEMVALKARRARENRRCSISSAAWISRPPAAIC